MGDKLNLDEVLNREILPCLPAVAVKILSLDQDADLDDLVQIIGQDVSLAARILKAANSPLYSPISVMNSTRRAVAFLGDRQVRSLVLAFSLIPMQHPQLDFTRFWEHSLATAVGARRVVRQINAKQADEAFTAGLMADIGLILLAGTLPKQYLRVLELRRQKAAPIQEIEREVFGFDHAAVGLAAAQNWRFPQNLQAVIAHHHEPDQHGGAGSDSHFVRAVHLAGALADLFYAARPDLIKKKVMRALAGMTELKETSFDDLVSGIEAETREASLWLGIRAALNRSAEDILQEANKRLAALNTEREQDLERLLKTHIELIQIARNNPPGR